MSNITKPSPQVLTLEEQRLMDRAKYLHDRGTPENTKRGYAGDWRRFRAWCERMNRTALPASAETMILYITHLADPHRPPESPRHKGGVCKPSTIERALSAIAFVHRVEGLRSPRGYELVRQHLSRTKKALKTPKKQAAPLLAKHLSDIIDEMDRRIEVRDQSPAISRDRAILLLGWCCALRRSEIVALDRDDISFREEGLVVNVSDSKTDQEGEGALIPVEPASVAALCPVRATRTWLGRRGEEGPVFCRTYRGKMIWDEPMPDWEVDAVVKKWTLRAGIESENPRLSFSAHSLRAGLITEAARAQKPEWRIMEHTRHKSYEVFREYIRLANIFVDNPQSGLL